jgi:hypothetical protein
MTEITTSDFSAYRRNTPAEAFQIRFARPISHYELDPATGTPAIYHSAQMGQQLHVHCPHCQILSGRGPDQAHHCYISLTLQAYRCMRCGDTGTLRYLLEQKTPKQIIEHRQRPKTSYPKTYHPNPRTVRPPDPSGYALSNLSNSATKQIRNSNPFRSGPGRTVPLKALPITHIAWQYLLNEKFDKKQLDDVLEVFRVYYCEKGRQIGKNPANTTEHRLIFEVSHQDKVVGWQARWLPAAWPPQPNEFKRAKEAGVQKYLLNPGFSKNAWPYNYDLAIHAQTVIAVEGVKKVWKAGANAIGTFGIQFTLPPPPATFEEQPSFEDPWIHKLLYHRKILYILFDRGTEPEAHQTHEWYRIHGGQAKIIKLPEYGPDDLDDYTRDEIKKLLGL